MMKTIVLFQLIALLLLFVGCSAQQQAEPTHVRRASVEDRDLMSFSWTNLMFKLGMCHNPSSTCPEYSSNSCGCPDCSKRFIPPHLRSYCKNLSGGSSSSSGSGEGGGGYDYGGGGNGGGSSTSESYEEGSTVRDGSASRTFKAWMFIMAGTAVAAAGAGMVYRRQNATQQTKDATDYKLSGAKSGGGSGGRVRGLLAGMGLVGGAAAADATDDESSAASVKKRMNKFKLGGGQKKKGVDPSGTAPAFLSVPSRLGRSPTLVEGERSVEVEGPFRPSTYEGPSSKRLLQ